MKIDDLGYPDDLGNLQIDAAAGKKNTPNPPYLRPVPSTTLPCHCRREGDTADRASCGCPWLRCGLTP